jgi:tRNA G18 (ribose-2'-O)-methylase SpoU
VSLVRERKLHGDKIWALEGGEDAAPIGSAPIVDSVTWAIGNENAGIDPAILKICENVFYLPMLGEKESLNVVIAFGAAAYFSGFFQK